MCEFFIERGASIAVLKELDLNSLLVQVCKRLGSVKKNEAEAQFLLFLLQQGLAFDVNKVYIVNPKNRRNTQRELTPLMAAAEAGKIQLVEKLLERGAEVRQGTIQGAAARDHYDVVCKLLLYAPLMYDKKIVDESRLRFKTFLLCMRRLGVEFPKDLLWFIIPDEIRALIAHRLRYGRGIPSSLQAYAKNAIWGSLPEALATEMRDALTVIKEDAVNGDNLSEILGDPGMLLEYLKGDIQELCNGKTLALMPG
jgi:hypothetical protein